MAALNHCEPDDAAHEDGEGDDRLEAVVNEGCSLLSEDRGADKGTGDDEEDEGEDGLDAIDEGLEASWFLDSEVDGGEMEEEIGGVGVEG